MQAICITCIEQDSNLPICETCKFNQADHATIHKIVKYMLCNKVNADQAINALRIVVHADTYTYILELYACTLEDRGEVEIRFNTIDWLMTGLENMGKDLTVENLEETFKIKFTQNEIDWINCDRDDPIVEIDYYCRSCGNRLKTEAPGECCDINEPAIVIEVKSPDLTEAVSWFGIVMIDWLQAKYLNWYAFEPAECSTCFGPLRWTKQTDVFFCRVCNKQNK